MSVRYETVRATTGGNAYQVQIPVIEELEDLMYVDGVEDSLKFVNSALRSVFSVKLAREANEDKAKEDKNMLKRLKSLSREQLVELGLIDG